ncbi:MAG: DUF333 domain-containing protein [Candidatus Pacebacteria bacterium]|nr:DUF333 domain-containing protein [Candidatus Paceibacterota bacterium]
MKYEKIIIAVAIIFLLTPLFHISAMETGMRNPAAAYCVDLGYEYDTRETAGGEQGICIFPDGSEASGWSFFVGQEKREFNFCAINGYGTKTVSDQRCLYNTKCTLCVLDDGAEKEVTSLMKLEVVVSQKEDNPKEIKVIKKLDWKDYFKNISGYLLGAILIILILTIAIIYKKKNKSKI